MLPAGGFAAPPVHDRAASAAVSGQPPATQLATIARCAALSPPLGGMLPLATSRPIVVQSRSACAYGESCGRPLLPVWQAEHTGWNTCGTKSPSYDAHWFAAAAGGVGGCCACVGVAGGTVLCGAGFKVGFTVVSLEAAALAGVEPEPLAALLAGSDGLLVLLGVELPELLFCGAACDEELPGDVPDCWKGAGSAGAPQAASAAMGIRTGTNHDERWSMN